MDAINPVTRDANTNNQTSNQKPKEREPTQTQFANVLAGQTSSGTGRTLRSANTVPSSTVMASALAGAKSMKSRASASTAATTSSSTDTTATDSSTSTSSTDTSAILLEETQKMQETNQSFNLQYLQLQENMQADNRQFTTLSNVLKTKQDTAKNAINNVR